MPFRTGSDGQEDGSVPTRSFPLAPTPLRVPDGVLDGLRRRLNTTTRWPPDAGNAYYGVRRPYFNVPSLPAAVATLPCGGGGSAFPRLEHALHTMLVGANKWAAFVGVTDIGLDHRAVGNLGRDPLSVSLASGRS